MSTNTRLHAQISTDFKVTNSIDNHTWYSDEPTELGGEDFGPKPTELFLSSLASCILITIRMYSQRKGWDTGVIEINLNMNVLEKSTEITKEILFSGNLTDEQKTRLMDISNRCPVAKIITNPIEFKFQ